MLLVQLVFMVDIIIFTGSRTGYIALVFALLFLIWKSKNRIRTFFLFFLIGLAITPLIPHDYIERVQTIFTQKDKEGNSTGLRKEIIDVAHDAPGRATGHFMNVGCMMPWMDYTPRALDEIIEAWEIRYGAARTKED